MKGQTKNWVFILNPSDFQGEGYSFKSEISLLLFYNIGTKELIHLLMDCNIGF